MKSETIIIRRRPNNRIVIRHTIDGQLVNRAQVVKNANDEDNFLTGAFYALEKIGFNLVELLDMSAAEHYPSYPDTDTRSLKVGDKVYCERSAGDKDFLFCGTLEEHNTSPCFDNSWYVRNHKKRYQNTVLEKDIIMEEI